MDDLLQRLEQMNSRLQHLQQLAAQARRAMSKRSEGQDRSSSVLVVLGQDRLPESIAISAEWRQRMEPGELGTAVLEAARTASIRQIEAWEDGAARFAAARSPLAEPAQTNDDSALQQRSEGFTVVPPRPVDQLVEDLLSEVRHAEPPTPPSGLGKAVDGRVALQVTPAGLISCEIDGDWATRQDSAGLTRALQHALANALDDLRRSTETAAGCAQGIDGLLAEALALFTIPGRMAESMNSNKQEGS